MHAITLPIQPKVPSVNHHKATASTKKNRAASTRPWVSWPRPGMKNDNAAGMLFMNMGNEVTRRYQDDSGEKSIELKVQADSPFVAAIFAMTGNGARKSPFGNCDASTYCSMTLRDQPIASYASAGFGFRTLARYEVRGRVPRSSSRP